MSRKAHRGFTMIDLVVVVLVIGFLAALLPAQLFGTRERANRAECAKNLMQIGKAMMMYCNDNKAYPRGPFDPAKLLTAGTKGKDTGAIFAEVDANDCSVPLFLLLRADIDPSTLVCPSSDAQLDKFGGKTANERSNFTALATAANGGNGNLSYSIQCPYPLNKESNFKWVASGGIPADVAIAADLNPGVSKDGSDNVVIADATDKAVSAANSRNHNKAGQNVLFIDGHVEWQTTPLCGKNKDNIYTYGPGQQGKCDGAANSGPQDATDSYLLPAYNWEAGK